MSVSKKWYQGKAVGPRPTEISVVEGPMVLLLLSAYYAVKRGNAVRPA